MRRILSVMGLVVVSSMALPATVPARSSAPQGATTVGSDFNGDGYADLAIGAPGEDVGALDRVGAVNVLYGSSSGPTYDGNQLWHQGSDGVEGTVEAVDGFGSSVAAGDFDADGHADLAIGVPGEDIGDVSGAGAVNVLYGTASGLSADGDQVWRQGAGGLAGAPGLHDDFGRSLATGDFDGDGYTDLAVGASGDLGPGGEQGAGAVNILHGSASGLHATAQLWTRSMLPGDPESSQRFGWSLAAANFGRGSEADLAIGIRGEGVGGNHVAGAVGVIYGSSTGLTATGTQLWTQANIGGPPIRRSDHFGNALAAGDFGKTGAADLAIGIPYEDVGRLDSAGAVAVLYGSARGLTAAGAQFWTQDETADEPEEGDGFGYTLAAGNLGKGGQADLVVGVPAEEVNGYVVAGAVHVLYGGSDGLRSAGQAFLHPGTNQIIFPLQAYGGFGASLAVGRFHGPGISDLAIGAPSRDVRSAGTDYEDAGTVFVLFGSARGFVPGSQAWTQAGDVAGALEAGDRFGDALG